MTKYPINTKYSQGLVTLKRSTYPNGNLRLDLISVQDGIQEATVSINLKDIILKPDEFVCKNYSENEGMEYFLKENCIAVPTGVSYSVGHSYCKVFKLIV